MKFESFSEKQLLALTWWCAQSPYSSRDAIICDGAVRSGKTLCMSISYIFWAFANFDGRDFALCGKTIASLKRNVITPLTKTLSELGFTCNVKLSRNIVEIVYKNRMNRFYLFGGKDESSAALIQGITLGGVLFDEVALMPRSFVEQALARCSLSGSKFWFNCNPENPFHWFYVEWIQKKEQKNALYVHFLMDDNPSLTETIRKRYHSLYSGAFYDRFVLGKWVAATGTVYSMFDYDKHVVETLPPAFEEHYISCDYGTVNPASFGLWGKSGSKWYRMREYYYDSKQHGAHKTDEEYYTSLLALAGGLPITAVVIDPSAASFIECVKRRGDFHVLPGKNDVLTGIRKVSDCLQKEKIAFHHSCTDTLREFSLYSWEDKEGKDCPRKTNDHAMDDIRYFVHTVLSEEPDHFFVFSASRQ